MKKSIYISFIVLAAISMESCHHQKISQPLTEADRIKAISDSVNMDVLDAEHWEWTPEVGYWCTDPKGCPVKGNTANVGTRLVYALPLPQGTGYKSEDRFNQIEWNCAKDEGCACGLGIVERGASCHGDMYLAKEAVSGKCNKDNCDAYCKNDQCICGDDVIVKDKFSGLTCNADFKVCRDLGGCKVGDKNYSMYETWVENEFKCYEEDGCQCGRSRCEEYDMCDPSVEKCKNSSGEYVTREQEEKKLIPEGYELDNGSLVCRVESGCKCAKQLCHPDEVCEDNVCVEMYYGEGDYELRRFYCDKPEGCICGLDNSICPNGAFCEETESRYHCFKADEKYNRTSNYPEMEMYIESEYTYFDKEYVEYFTKESNEKKSYHILHDYNNESMYVRYMCSEPGCDCGGTPLKENYLCVENYVVLARAQYGAWLYMNYGYCREPYKYNNGYCDIYESVIEQVCFNPDGCACGGSKISMWDVCDDGHGKCSSDNSRSGCDCNGVKLPENYGCYKGELICQESTCHCGDKEIQPGDICKNGEVICAKDSTTSGCMCGVKALRKNYQCVNNEQHCFDSECSCGDQTISSGDVCRNDDTTVIIQKEEEAGEVTGGEKEGYYLLSCGERKVKIALYDSTVFDVVSGEYLDIESAGDQKEYCTCGTGNPAPSDDYVCSFNRETIGEGCDWESYLEFRGWECLNFGGCACGDSICQAGDVCIIKEDGKGFCDDETRYNAECSEHKLTFNIVAEGYKCYNGYVNAEGWYCDKAEGCACGDVKCEQWQMCLAAGHCGKHRLEPGESNELGIPVIEYIEDF